MSPTTEQLLTSALTLPESERLELAEALLAASEPPAPEPTGDAWLAELHRRSAQIDAGAAVLIPERVDVFIQILLWNIWNDNDLSAEQYRRPRGI